MSEWCFKRSSGTSSSGSGQRCEPLPPTAGRSCRVHTAFSRLSAGVRLDAHACPVQVAPITTQHIFNLIAMGGYISNHFFRVEKGFVIQTRNVEYGRNVTLTDELKVTQIWPAS